MLKHAFRYLTNYQRFSNQFFYPCFSTLKNKKIIEKFESEHPITNEIAQEVIRPTKRYIYSKKEDKITEIEETKPRFTNVPNIENGTQLSRVKKTTTEANVPDEPTERLSKRLARLGVCSRREAEKFIGKGIVKVNGSVALSNIPVTENDKITIFTKHGDKLPIKESSRIWVFNKPKRIICTHDDPQKRMTIYQYLKGYGFEYDKHFISVGRLDYNSEGLILLTNDGELSRVLENPDSAIERIYRVRIFGRFDELKLQKIRQGTTINGIKYGPYWCEVEKRQTRNTWLRIKLTTGKNREIRKLMQKFSLRVNRIMRIKYGPYTLGGLQPGQWEETILAPDIKKKLYLHLRHKLNDKQMELESAKANQLLEAVKEKKQAALPNREQKTPQIGAGGRRKAKITIQKFSERLAITQKE